MLVWVDQQFILLCTNKIYYPLTILMSFQDKFEVQKCSAAKGQNVIIIDDLLATGGKYHALLFNILTYLQKLMLLEPTIGANLKSVTIDSLYLLNLPIILLLNIIFTTFVGTMAAAYKLMKDLEADVLECIVLVELENLNGRSKIPGKVFSVIKRND